MEWLIPASIALLLAMIVMVSIVVPISMRLRVSGRGEFGKSWAVAGDFHFWFAMVSVDLAQGVHGVLQLRVAGMRVMRMSPLRSKKKKAADAELGLEKEPAKKRKPVKVKVMTMRQAWRRVDRWFDPVAIAEFGLSLLRFVRLERCSGTLVYATPDVAFTGMLSGLFYCFAGIMAPFGDLRVEPQWDAALRAGGNLDVTVRLWPMKMVLSAVGFALRNIKLRERAPVRVAPALS